MHSEISGHMPDHVNGNQIPGDFVSDGCVCACVCACVHVCVHVYMNKYLRLLFFFW